MGKRERIIITTSNKRSISKLTEKLMTHETVNVLGNKYKVVSAGLTVDCKGRVFELEGQTNEQSRETKKAKKDREETKNI